MRNIYSIINIITNKIMKKILNFKRLLGAMKYGPIGFGTRVMK